MGGRPAPCLAPCPAGAAPLRDPGKAWLSNQNRVCLATAPGSRTLLVEKTVGFLKTLSSSDSAPKPPSSSSLPEVFPDPPSSGRGWVSGQRVGEGGGKGTKERAEAGVAVPGGDRQGRPSCGRWPLLLPSGHCLSSTKPQATPALILRGALPDLRTQVPCCLYGAGLGESPLRKPPGVATPPLLLPGPAPLRRDNEVMMKSGI